MFSSFALVALVAAQQVVATQTAKGGVQWVTLPQTTATQPAATPAPPPAARPAPTVAPVAVQPAPVLVPATPQAVILAPPTDSVFRA